jgi:dihydroxy-acid dehydratase
MPGCAMAAARHNRPTIIVYGGTIQIGERNVDCPAMGHKKGDPVNISDAFESYGKWWRRGALTACMALLTHDG